MRARSPLSVLATVLAAVTAALAPAAPAQAATPVPRADHVLVVGVAGLRWDHVSAERTPALWRLASRGSTGSLSVRAALATTCPGEGWATLGAGNRARGPARDPEPGAGCPPDVPASEITVRSDGSAEYRQQHTLVEENRRLGFDARPGSLADALPCTTTIGSAAAPAGARASGRMDRYLPRLPAAPAAVLAACPATILAGPSVPEGIAEDGTEVDTDAALAAVDRFVARIESSRPDDSVLLVVGTADLAAPPRLHVVIADGDGYGDGRLVSPSTRRAGFVQLIDIAPTVLATVGATSPRSIVGRPMHQDGVAPRLAEAVGEMVDADVAAAEQRPLVDRFFTLVVTLGLALYVGAAWTFTRAWRRTAGPRSPRVGPGRPGAVLEIVALALAAAVPATLLAQVVPWWRTPVPGAVVAGVVIAVTAAVVALALRGPWRHSAVGPIGVVAAFAAVVLAGDVLTGSNLQFGSLLGYSPLVAGRFTGFGNISFAVFAAGVLIAAGCVAQALRRELRPYLLGGIGVVAVVLIGAPTWGSDVGGLVAMAGAVVVATMHCAGIRLSIGRVAAAVGIGSLAVVAFALVDVNRPPSQQTHLARFVAQLQDGSAVTVVERKAGANLGLLVNSPLTLLVLGAVVLLMFVLLRPVGGLRRVFALYPGVRSGFIGVAVAAAVGFAVNDSGIAVPAFAASLAVPLAIAVAVRVAAAHALPGQPARKPAAVLYAPPAPVSEQSPPPVSQEPPATGTDTSAPEAGREPVPERAP
jgi:hypothetical protein